MNIGIDARPLATRKASGIGTYLAAIVSRLRISPENKYFLYTNEPIQNDSIDLSLFEQRIIDGKIGTLAVSFGLKKQLLKDKVDVFWGTEHMLPLNIKGIKLVLTVHDLGLMIQPRWGTLKNSIMQNVFCRLACYRADYIIADSNATKYDLIHLLKINPDKISTILLGGNSNNLIIEENKTENIGEKFRIKDRKYFLYLGTLEPRKNIVGIIDAFEKFCAVRSENYKLVLAGKMGWGTKDINERINKCHFRNLIVLTGYITESEKNYLIEHTVAFMFPSHYEGFGIPVIEAMSYGVPVITACNSSLPEVGGKFAFYVKDSHDTNDIAKQMSICAVLSENERSELASKEQNWADSFSWKTCAERTQEILESI